MVSVIIVNYNSLHLTEECIRSVFEHTRTEDFEVIVVDNASQPGCALKLAEAFPQQVRTIELTENVGFGRANNAGFEAARGEFLFCLNPDTILISDAVGILAGYLRSHPDAGACGGNLYSPAMLPLHSFRRILPGPFWALSERFHRHPERLIYGRNTRFNRTGRPLDVAYITGADLMLRREAVAQTGGFSPEFFMYFEETDLCCRLRLAGWRIVSVPEARIIHLEGATTADADTRAADARRLTMYRASFDTYLRRHLPERSRRLTRLLAKE